MLQDFSSPITLEQQEATDWTKRREVEQRVAETEHLREKGGDQDGGRHEPMWLLSLTGSYDIITLE